VDVVPVTNQSQDEQQQCYEQQSRGLSCVDPMAVMLPGGIVVVLRVRHGAILAPESTLMRGRRSYAQTSRPNRKPHIPDLP